MSTEGEVLVRWEAEREGGSGVVGIRALRVLEGSRGADQGPRGKKRQNSRNLATIVFLFRKFLKNDVMP